VITRSDIANKIVEIVQRDVDERLRETHGKNRSPRIDYFNSRANAPMGSPYCASGIWSAIDDACLSLGLQNPIPPTAWSQAFRKSGFTPKAYIKPQGELGKIGDVAVFQVVSDPSRGHLALVRADQKTQPKFLTLEYNTDGSGSRDGDGCYSMSRSTIGKTGNKVFVCFTDVCQWILDHNFPPRLT
jgi:hypothetical protein